MNYYLTSKEGASIGPFTLEEIRSKMTSGEVLPTDLCWGEGMADWQPISEVEGLSLKPTSPPPPPVVVKKEISDARPRVQCMDCGHIGPAVKKEYSTGLAVAEYIWGAVLFLACIIPGFIYIAIVSSKKRKLAEMRYCEKCGSSAIHPYHGS